MHIGVIIQLSLYGMRKKAADEPTPLESIPQASTVRAKSNWLSMALFCGVVFLVHLMLLRFHPVVNFDGCWYARWFDDPAWRGSFPPMYPMLIRLFNVALNDVVLSGQIASAILGSLLAVPVHLLARKFITRSELVWTATAFVVLNPLIFKNGLLVLSDVPYLFFLATAIYYFVQGRTVLTGVFTSLGYLTKPEMAAVVVVFAAILIARKDLRSAAVMASVIFLLALPYLVFIHQTTGTWSPTLKTADLRVWSDTSYLMNETVAPKQHSTAEIISSVVASYPHRFMQYTGHIIEYAGIPIVLLGLAGVIRNPSILLVGLMNILLLPVFGIITDARLIIPCVAFLTIFAFIAIDRLRKGALVLTIGCGLFLLPLIQIVVIPDEPLVELKQAGLALKNITAPGDRFLDRKPFTAFYAGGEYWAAPYAPLDSILHFAVNNHVRFIVVSEYVVLAFRQQLEPLLKLHGFTAFGSEYSLVYRDSIGGVNVFQREK